jgi:peptide deformylase
MVDILQQHEPVLRELAQEVPLKDILGVRIQKVLKDMKAALDSQEDGVGIAAPQIGVPLRIFMVSGAVFDAVKNKEDDGIDIIKRKADKKNVSKDLICINPVITKLSKSTEWMEEGCLSVRYLYGKVKRSSKATIQAYDEHGKKFERGGGALLAHIFQHEVDHLDGILFIDKARDIEDIPPPEKK